MTSVVLAGSPRQSLLQSRLLGITQGLTMMIFLAILGYFLGRVRVFTPATPR